MRNRIAAAIAAVAIIGLAGCSAEAEPTAAEQPTRSASTAQAPSTAPSSTPAPEPTYTITGIVDGDTVDTSAGRVRVIGIDTPETGQCGYEQASANAAQVVPVGATVTLTAVPGKDDTDKYGRLLRYVSVGSTDLGLAQINAGFAVARYDSRDGYGSHPKEAEYVAADAATAQFECTPPPPAPEPAPAPASTPAPAPAPEAAPSSTYYANCSAVRAAGAAPIYKGDPGYSSKLDRDGDGVACE
jgi:endonuclease YncB( thermonuclease family)